MHEVLIKRYFILSLGLARQEIEMGRELKLKRDSI